MNNEEVVSLIKWSKEEYALVRRMLMRRSQTRDERPTSMKKMLIWSMEEAEKQFKKGEY